MQTKRCFYEITFDATRKTALLRVFHPRLQRGWNTKTDYIFSLKSSSNRCLFIPIFISEVDKKIDFRNPPHCGGRRLRRRNLQDQCKSRRAVGAGRRDRQRWLSGKSGPPSQLPSRHDPLRRCFRLASAALARLMQGRRATPVAWDRRITPVITQ
mgnify:CR=1 FL=1